MKTNKLFLVVLCTLMGAISIKAAEACAAYDASTKTLTFYYDSQAHSGDVGPLPSSSTFRPWWIQDSNVCSNIEKVVFDPSFAGYHITSAYCWFSGMTNLTSITGMQYFNTDRITTMQSMFSNCSKLKNIDLSHFNTRSVTNMYSMFMGCSGLTSLDLSSFETANVTNMGFMFYACNKLTTLDVTPLRTPVVTTMEDMFAGCSRLTCLNLVHFNTYRVTDMTGMFSGCSSLVTIYVDDDDWNVNGVTESNSMFRNCTSIVGGRGTTYNSSHIDKLYAHIDHGPNSNAPGYLTRQPAAYAVFTASNATLTFYFDDNYPNISNKYMLNNADEIPGWHAKAGDVRQVVFDPSFADCYPLTTAYWFADMEYLTSITGMEYLNTGAVTNMCGMFYQARNLKSVDLSHFETHNVVNMSGMFFSCHAFTSLDLRSFDTRNVQTMTTMFMFCRNLVTIAVSDKWSTEKLYTNDFSYSMFEYCTAIRGCKGTTYDSNYVDHTYAHIDGGSSNPGYLSDTVRGDVNGDGKVNVSDVTALVNMILGVIPKDFTRGDINGDGKINVSDVTVLINLILGAS
ncbi:MAG: BspA family leucine-rich repeat surface protein [Muribaculaceae bacterium]|nr:BspA family leucine-rich repeat surface protein [Muribaculaceae bacterium]